MCGNMQESGLPEVIPPMCASALRPVPCVFPHPELRRALQRAGCSPRTAGSQVFLSFLSAFRAPRLTGDCSPDAVTSLFTDTVGNTPFLSTQSQPVLGPRCSRSHSVGSERLKALYHDVKSLSRALYRASSTMLQNLIVLDCQFIHLWRSFSKQV